MVYYARIMVVGVLNEYLLSARIDSVIFRPGLYGLDFSADGLKFTITNLTFQNILT